MRTTLTILAAAVAATAGAAQFRAGAGYTLTSAHGPYAERFDSPLHGFAGDFGWNFWGPLNVEISGGYRKAASARSGFSFPEVHHPRERAEFPLTAAVALAVETGPFELFAAGGGGLLHERYRFVAVYLDPVVINHAVATMGAGFRARLPRNFYVEARDDFLLISGRQFDYWYQSGEYFYLDDHADENVIKVGGGFFF